MKPNILLLTSDHDLELASRCSADLGGFDLVIGRRPNEGTDLLSKHKAALGAVIVDLDISENGVAWLGAISSLPQKVPVIAVSRLDRRFLEPMAKRHGVEHWLSKPITAFRLATELKPLCARPLGENSGP